MLVTSVKSEVWAALNPRSSLRKSFWKPLAGATNTTDVVMGLWGRGFRDRAERLQKVLTGGRLGSSGLHYDPSAYWSTNTFGTSVERYLEFLAAAKEWTPADFMLAASIVDCLEPELVHLRDLSLCSSLGWGPLDGCTRGRARGIPWPYFDNVLLWLEPLPCKPKSF